MDPYQLSAAYKQKLIRLKKRPSTPQRQRRIKSLRAKRWDIHHPVPANPSPPRGGVAPTDPPATNNQMPWDAQYESDSARLSRDHQMAMSGLQAQEAQTRQDYGFDDASNPFSRAMLLQRSYDQAKLGTMTSQAGRGQLYSGSTGNALGLDRFNFESNFNSLSNEYRNALQDIADKRVQATTTRDEGFAAAEAARLQAALQDRVAPEEAPEATPAPGPNPGEMASYNRKKDLRNRLRELNKKARRSKSPQPRRTYHKKAHKLQRKLKLL